MEKPKLYLINGPLGAGKTTFLQHMLSQPAFTDARVIENEFASTSIDTQTLHNHQAEVQTIAGTCVCCGTGEELIEALIGFTKSNEPVVIEATGVANSLQLVEKLVLGNIFEHYQLAHAIFVLDGAEATPDLLATYSDELRAADTILLSKLDLVPQDQSSTLRKSLTELGSGQVLPVEHGVVDLTFLDQTSQILDFYANHSEELRKHDGAANYTVLTPDYPINPTDLEAAWPTIRDTYGLQRLKGDIVDESGESWHVQATPSQIRLTQGEGDVNKIVCIGKDARKITAAELKECL